MIYIVSILGFIGGFLIGQLLLARFLKDVSNEDLLNDPSLHFKYGTLNWAIAIMMSVAVTHLYNIFI